MDVSSRYGSKIAQLALWLVLCITLPAVCHAQQKHALMIGISNYYTNGYKVWENIHGAEDMRALSMRLPTSSAAANRAMSFICVESMLPHNADPIKAITP